jgi:hypothetical protein
VTDRFIDLDTLVNKDHLTSKDDYRGRADPRIIAKPEVSDPDPPLRLKPHHKRLRSSVQIREFPPTALTPGFRPVQHVRTSTTAVSTALEQPLDAWTYR